MIEKTTRIYEVLIRFGPGGRVAGMQSQDLTEVTEDGAVLTSSIGEALVIHAAGLVALLAPEDRAELAAALSAVT